MNTYEIRTINDVFNLVPADRISDCLNEFGVALTQMAQMRDKLSEMYGSDVSQYVSLPESHKWVDDNKREVTVGVNVNGQDLGEITTIVGAK